MSDPAKRYRAFISYSQKDKAQARRLHQALERYRLPNHLEAAKVDRKTRKLGRFFRDDEEMGAATDLGAALQGAIADAENLIVVCSPHAAQSKWVNEEIIHFKRTGRAENIFALIVAGVPHSADEQECFPPALRFAVGVDGAPSDQPAEPLAVDLRKERFARVLTRLVAGLAQIPFDALWKREQRRAAAQAVTLSTTVFFIALVVAGALTQSFWYPRVDAYWRFARHAQPTEELMGAAPGTTFQDCRVGSSDCPVMVVVPEGQFLMGSTEDDPENYQDWESPLRRVDVARFAVSQNEITFADWLTCFEARACGNEMPDRFGWRGDDRPVINVSWDDAQKYVSWLSRMTGQHYRLLTEAEWEYAARAVTIADAAHHTRFAWGSDDPVCERHMPNGAAWGECPEQSTFPVGSFPTNAFGLHDMHGNVWEWVEDCYVDNGRGALTLGGSTVAAESEACSQRIRRGGAWNYYVPHGLRSAMRAGDAPSTRTESIGFRVARTL
jgi:formylglycine-generating enzyme required for sulfatase activity